MPNLTIDKTGVRCDLLALAVSLIHSRLQFFERERRNVVEHSVFAHPIRAIAVDLDPVRVMADPLSHGLTRVVGAIHDLISTRHHHGRRISMQRIRSSHIPGTSGDLHPRSGNHSVVNGLLHIGICVSRALGLEIADRSESILQNFSFSVRVLIPVLAAPV
jgi:hypothetical protein